MWLPIPAQTRRLRHVVTDFHEDRESPWETLNGCRPTRNVSLDCRQLIECSIPISGFARSIRVVHSPMTSRARPRLENSRKS